MNRIAVLSLAIPLMAACGGSESSSTPSVRSNADELQARRDEIKALGENPSDVSSEVPRLLRAMNDPDPEIRWRAEFALGRVQPSGIKALVEALRDKSPRIRTSAAQVLGPLGRRAAASVPTLLDALADPEGDVRAWTVKALGDIDPGNPQVTGAFLKTLRDPNPDVRRVTLVILIRMGPAVAGSANVLADVLQDADAGIRADACIALRRLGTDGKAGVTALIPRLSDPDTTVRKCAVQALMSIGPAGLPPLVRALKERDARTRKAAAEVIGSFGSEGRSATVDLTETARDGDAEVQAAAVQALKRVQSEGGEGAQAPASPFIESPEIVARRAAEYKWAKFGLFVHWGIYSVPARAKPGQVSEAVMVNDTIPVKEYEHFALNFAAENFKPGEWAKLANETGARYLMLTAKSQDGFCLWNTKLTEFSSARIGMSRRDLLGELATACEKEGVKFCASYSLEDWHHPDYEKSFPRYLEYLHGQVKELLAGYPLWGIWFDGDLDHAKSDWRCDDLVMLVRRTRPQAFVNDRFGPDARGLMTGIDFYTDPPEATPAALRLQRRPTAWEAREPFGESRGYVESPDPLKSAERIIVDLVDAVSRGGNFLLSVGARPDGTLPEAFRARMKLIGAWLQKNGDAIYDTDRSPFGGPVPAGRVTAKGTRLYVFLEDLPKDGTITLPGLKTKVREAWVVDGKKELKVRETGIQAPGDLIEGSPLTVIGIELEGPPEVAK
jgi:alpha-L-fucosidase